MSLHYMFELALTVRIISMIVPMSNMIPDHLLFCGLGILDTYLVLYFNSCYTSIYATNVGVSPIIPFRINPKGCQMRIIETL